MSNVFAAVNENRAHLSDIFRANKNGDIIMRDVRCANISVLVVFLDGMVSNDAVNHYVIEACRMHTAPFSCNENQRAKFLCENVLSISDVSLKDNYDDVTSSLLSGQTALFVDGDAQAVIMETRGYPMRSVSSTRVESVVFGSQEGFVENLRSNITLVRRILRSPRLVSEMLSVGKTETTDCALMYLDGIAPPSLIEAVKTRITSLNIDMTPGAGHLEQLIEDHPYSPFPTMLATERPDRTAKALSSGQVAIILDGSPSALLLPIPFYELLHTADDDYLRWQYATFLRLFRTLGLFVAVLFPAIYVALSLYHQNIIPMSLLQSIAETRLKVPFTVVTEVLLMEAAFGLIIEASTRTPSIMGSTIGIIGALILGQAAVAANIISPILIIVVSLTGLGNFVIPNYGMTIGLRMLNLAFILVAAVAGIYGIILMLCPLVIYMCGMKSFGQPYLAPLAPKRAHNPNILVRFPLYMQKLRADFAQPGYRKRAGDVVRMWRHDGKK